MTRVDDLLLELRTHLGAAVSYTMASAANDVYEGFLFSLVVATARARLHSRRNRIRQGACVGGPCWC
jgi:hypothetical protein